METKKFNSISRCYINVTLIQGESHYRNSKGEILLRIETKGKTGKTMYRTSFYIMGDKEMGVHGMGGQTGFGWGGRIVGYATLEEINNCKIRIR